VKEISKLKHKIATTKKVIEAYKKLPQKYTVCKREK